MKTATFYGNFNFKCPKWDIKTLFTVANPLKKNYSGAMDAQKKICVHGT